MNDRWPSHTWKNMLYLNASPPYFARLLNTMHYTVRAQLYLVHSTDFNDMRPRVVNNFVFGGTNVLIWLIGVCDHMGRMHCYCIWKVLLYFFIPLFETICSYDEESILCCRHTAYLVNNHTNFGQILQCLVDTEFVSQSGQTCQMLYSSISSRTWLDVCGKNCA